MSRVVGWGDAVRGRNCETSLPNPLAVQKKQGGMESVFYVSSRTHGTPWLSFFRSSITQRSPFKLKDLPPTGSLAGSGYS